MSEPFIGEIRMFGGNFAPNGWAFCNGQLLSIAQNSALFSILGTTYGGNGQTTFGLPNLQGRFPMHWGNGAGLSPRTLGETSGTESVTILQTQMPAHTHTVNANNQNGDSDAPTGVFWAKGVDSNSNPVTNYAGNANTTMAPNAIGPSGGNQPLPIMNPYQCVSFIIALEGIYPSRS